MKYGNSDNLSPEDREKLEDSQYRKQLIASHGFCADEYENVSKLPELEYKRKIRELEQKVEGEKVISLEAKNIE